MVNCTFPFISIPFGSAVFCNIDDQLSSGYLFPSGRVQLLPLVCFLHLPSSPSFFFFFSFPLLFNGVRVNPLAGLIALACSCLRIPADPPAPPVWQVGLQVTLNVCPSTLTTFKFYLYFLVS